MRVRIILGCALTAAVLTMVATVISGIVAADLVSIRDGAITQAVLVPAALVVTVLAWRTVLEPSDRPETLLAGLMGGWLLNTASWTGHAFVGRLFTDVTPVAIVVDAGLWLVLSVGLVATFVVVSPRPSRALTALSRGAPAASAGAARSSGSR